MHVEQEAVAGLWADNSKSGGISWVNSGGKAKQKELKSEENL